MSKEARTQLKLSHHRALHILLQELSNQVAELGQLEMEVSAAPMKDLRGWRAAGMNFLVVF